MNSTKPKLIVFVCRGNIVRSVVAEKILQQELVKQHLEDQFSVDSCGIQGTSFDPQPVRFPNITHYSKLYQDCFPVLKELNLDLSDHVSKPISQLIAREATLLVAMDSSVQSIVIQLFPEQSDKVILFSSIVEQDRSIPDPEGISGSVKQTQVLTDIRNIIQQGCSRLLELAKSIKTI